MKKHFFVQLMCPTPIYYYVIQGVEAKSKKYSGLAEASTSRPRERGEVGGGRWEAAKGSGIREDKTRERVF